MMRFADDMDLVTIEVMMESELNMKMSAMKTKTLVWSKKNNVRTRRKLKENAIIDQINYFRFLRSATSSDWRWKKEIVNRI